MKADSVLAGCELPTEAAVPPSTCRFPDGADFRIEIPSVEGPEVLTAVLKEAESRRVTVNRVSQGSGAMMQTDAEMRSMAAMAADAGLEVSLFVGPREEWGTFAQSRALDGPALAGNIRGIRQLRYAVEDVLRAVDCGIRGFLVADLGLMSVLRQAQRNGELPRDIVWKLSAIAAPSNPASVTVLIDLGFTTINLPSDLTIAELAAMRAVTDAPLDLYVESPDSMGGVVRGEQLADLVAAAAPLYAKFGLRNARSIYPAGLHLAGDSIPMVREKVRRASIALEWMQRAGSDAKQSEAGAVGLGIPVRA